MYQAYSIANAFGIPAPAKLTVEDHDATLENAAEAWRDVEDSPASRLLQAVLLAERIGQK